MKRRNIHPAITALLIGALFVPTLIAGAVVVAIVIAPLLGFGGPLVLLAVAWLTTRKTHPEAIKARERIRKHHLPHRG